jgi:hypothetical protein
MPPPAERGGTKKRTSWTSLEGQHLLDADGFGAAIDRKDEVLVAAVKISMFTSRRYETLARLISPLLEQRKWRR